MALTRFLHLVKDFIILVLFNHYIKALISLFHLIKMFVSL